MNNIVFHRRNLPHYYIPNSTYFITFRVKDSIPLSKIVNLYNRYEKMRFTMRFCQASINEQLFRDYDSLLDFSDSKKYFLRSELSSIIKKEIHRHDNAQYKLICYSIMPNHVHLIIHLKENSKDVGKILQNIKRISAYRINLILGKKGGFWQSESYDRVIRDQEELYATIKYTLYNPVKAGLVDNWLDYEGNFLIESLDF